MNYSSGLEYVIRSSYTHSYSNVNYFSRHSVDDNYNLGIENPTVFENQYRGNAPTAKYNKSQLNYLSSYPASHQFTPEIFLNPSRPKTRFIGDSSEAKRIAEEVFELMIKAKLPENISINILPFHDFKVLHSMFGAWSNGILGFSLNGANKQVFVRENNLDALMLVLGHEIGHVLTDLLPNKHDEEAKAFAFSVEWAGIIKKHNVANLGLSIKDDFGFQPARNGLHDVAFGFVDFMVSKGRTAMELHDDLARKYVSVFNIIYPK